MSLPVAREPAGIVIVAPPLVNVVAADIYPPPVSVTEPVGTGLPLPPATATVTVRLCTVVIVVAEGDTVTVGVVNGVVVPFPKISIAAP
jgi:hypothetical protein